MGHRVDRILGRPSHSNVFRESLEREFESLVKRYQKYHNYSKEEAYREISKTLRESHKYHSVSDLFGAMSDNKCVGRYRHEKTYWHDSERLEREAFAHFFEAMARNDTEKVEILKSVFPNSFALFLEMLNKV